MNKTYIDTLKEEFEALRDSGKDFDRELLYFPDMIKLLCDMLENEDVDKESRLQINVALGYLLVPNDIVPEDVYGAYGYLDDLYASCVVLAGLKQKYADMMLKLWNNEEPFEKVLDLCTYKSEKFLEEKGLKEKLLRFCGLSD
jgi:uncharacterized membrane protein YkvA (DUF1232 family)